MANLVTGLRQVHGTDPQFLVEKIVRERIFDALYWKEECFGLTAESVIDKAVELVCTGGVTTHFNRPTNFLCLVFKLLQLQPEKEIIIEYIRQEEFKYLRALGAFYLRLVGRGIDIYRYLEPLYDDYRKLRLQNASGNFELTHVDEFIDELLHGERVCDIILPRLVKRKALEDTEELEPRKSALEDDLDAELLLQESSTHEQVSLGTPTNQDTSLEQRTSASRDRSRSKSRERNHDRRERDLSRNHEHSHGHDHDRSRDRDHDRSRDRDRDRSRDRDRERYRPRARSRSHSRSRERHRNRRE